MKSEAELLIESVSEAETVAFDPTGRPHEATIILSGLYMLDPNTIAEEFKINPMGATVSCVMECRASEIYDPYTISESLTLTGTTETLQTMTSTVGLGYDREVEVRIKVTRAGLLITATQWRSIYIPQHY